MLKPINYTEQDKKFMRMAIDQAEAALEAGDYPVGGALVVDGELWGTGRNRLFSETRTSAHAEHDLIHTFSHQLRQRLRDKSKPKPQYTLYTTLEPCLMCLGITVMHRIQRIVIACPDPHGGVSGIDPNDLGAFYPEWWPTFNFGLYQEESCQLILRFLQAQKAANEQMQSWQAMLESFQQVAAKDL